MAKYVVSTVVAIGQCNCMSHADSDQCQAQYGSLFSQTCVSVTGTNVQLNCLSYRLVFHLTHFRPDLVLFQLLFLSVRM